MPSRTALHTRPIGLTKDAGWQIGARRTVAVSSDRAWEVITSPGGIKIWLGEAPDFRIHAGARYTTADGATGAVRVVGSKENGARRHLRITWQPANWSEPSIVQVRVFPSDTSGQTTISFHQEQLPDAHTRERMRRRWQDALDQLATQLEQPKPPEGI